MLDFTLACARVHAEICADLAKKGQLIGAHDLLIAATARRQNAGKNLRSSARDRNLLQLAVGKKRDVGSIWRQERIACALSPGQLRSTGRANPLHKNGGQP